MRLRSGRRLNNVGPLEFQAELPGTRPPTNFTANGQMSSLQPSADHVGASILRYAGGPHARASDESVSLRRKPDSPPASQSKHRLRVLQGGS